MITVNGQQAAFAQGDTVQTLLDARKLDAARVAVEHNGAILKRSDFAQTRLTDGDKIEIVHFVGGG